MIKKIILCTAMMMLTSVDATIGKAGNGSIVAIEQSDDDNKPQGGGQQELAGDPLLADDAEEYLSEREIDNFDFLYNDCEGYEYDPIAMDNLMDEAVKHIGARYRYGSKGPKAFDCSGFTSYVFKRQTDQNIGSSSREQYAKNQPIQRDELQRGDLVFFTSPRSGRSVGHVGIVVDVDPISDTFTFIHSSTGEGVKISKSTDGYYARRYVGARRVLSE